MPRWTHLGPEARRELADVVREVLGEVQNPANPPRTRRPYDVPQGFMAYSTGGITAASATTLGEGTVKHLYRDQTTGLLASKTVGSTTVTSTVYNTTAAVTGSTQAFWVDEDRHGEYWSGGGAAAAPTITPAFAWRNNLSTTNTWSGADVKLVWQSTASSGFARAYQGITPSTDNDGWTITAAGVYKLQCDLVYAPVLPTSGFGYPVPVGSEFYFVDDTGGGVAQGGKIEDEISVASSSGDPISRHAVSFHGFHIADGTTSVTWKIAAGITGVIDCKIDSVKATFSVVRITTSTTGYTSD